MPLDSDALIATIRKFVADRYETDTSPLLLSDLGQILRNQNLWQPMQTEGKTLRQVIEAARDPDLVIVRDKNSPAYVAVATAATKDIVEQFIERRSQARATIPDLEALPRSVLLAFCVRQENGKPVFLRKSPPFKYETDLPVGEDRDQFLCVEERYRRPGLKIAALTELTASDRLDLQTKIAAWSRDNGIPLEDFYKFKGKKRANALERLLAAQPPGAAEKIMIPGDIALILIQHE
jgi:hypothetical protein